MTGFGSSSPERGRPDVEMMCKSLREAEVTGGCADRYQPTDEVLQILENV
ncbi:uncharacterized protein SOCE26_066910 [Sorangium cellulosum]|uniref:Uncharacterized protein n=1 Tax=Sorangium cellulosum TaxID=56 RepID=A0A2L0F0Y0_SORCE|nr:hypothetical protein [Sorangium cellulosum]AUX45210.1 uncharacterized protein SOCE26_066910 [Sorangium cellulosum]